MLFVPFLIVQYLIFRIGVIDGYFYPNAIQDAKTGNIIKSYFMGGSSAYVNVLGIIP